MPSPTPPSPTTRTNTHHHDVGRRLALEKRRVVDDVQEVLDEHDGDLLGVAEGEEDLADGTAGEEVHPGEVTQKKADASNTRKWRSRRDKRAEWQQRRTYQPRATVSASKYLRF